MNKNYKESASLLMKKMADLLTKSAIFVLVAKAPIFTGLYKYK
jgi:hypothetical protein